MSRATDRRATSLLELLILLVVLVMGAGIAIAATVSAMKGQRRTERRLSFTQAIGLAVEALELDAARAVVRSPADVTFAGTDAVELVIRDRGRESRVRWAFDASRGRLVREEQALAGGARAAHVYPFSFLAVSFQREGEQLVVDLASHGNDEPPVRTRFHLVGLATPTHRPELTPPPAQLVAPFAD